MDVVSDGTGERHPFEERVAAFGADHHREWQQLIAWLEREYDREITLEAILFLVGIQSRGRGYEPELDRDIKENVIMEGTYCVMAAIGAYERVGMEANGMWIWERMIDPVGEMDVDDQEIVLKSAVLEYFRAELDEPYPWL